MGLSSLPYIPIPSWLVASLAGIWIALVLWQLVGRNVIATSRDRARLAQVTASGQDESPPISSGLSAEIEQAGLNISPASFNLLRLIGTGAGLVVVPALGLPPLLGIGLAVAAWWGSRAWLRGRAAGRGREMDKELPTALARIAALVDIEKDMPSLLLAVAEGLAATNPASPLAAELRHTATDLRSRGPVALSDLEARAPSAAVSTMAFNLRVFLESGGEQAKLMAEAAERMQRLLQGRNMARAKAASALTLAKTFPFLLLGVSFFTFQDPEIGAFYRSLIGQALLLVIGGVMLFGYWFIKKMVEDVA
jgi:Flp pilus assembly protein TadB